MEAEESPVKSISCEKFLVLKFDAKLTFGKHIKTACEKESNKLTRWEKKTFYAFK